MADLKITQFSADATPTGDDLITTIHDPGGTPANKKVTITNLFTSPTITTSLISAIAWKPSGRLTLTTAVPVTTADVTAATTVYYTPYNGNLIPLWNGATWTTIPFAEKSLSLSGLTADSNYDIFGYLDSGDLALEGLIWTNATTRATALVLTNGFYTKSGDQTRHYLGTIRINAAGGECEDTDLQRYVWNNYNRVARGMLVTDGTSHTYNSATGRQWNNDTANKVEFVLGLREDCVGIGWVCAHRSGLAGSNATVAFALDSTTSTGSAITGGACVIPFTNDMRWGNAGTIPWTKITTVGYHYCSLNQNAQQSLGANTATFTIATGYLSIMG